MSSDKNNVLIEGAPINHNIAAGTIVQNTSISEFSERYRSN
jgi:hypothetical protein